MRIPSLACLLYLEKSGKEMRSGPVCMQQLSTMPWDNFTEHRYFPVVAWPPVTKVCLPNADWNRSCKGRLCVNPPGTPAYPRPGC